MAVSVFDLFSTHAPDFLEPKTTRVPSSNAPAGMAFYDVSRPWAKRIRDVVAGPDGWLYLLSDDGGIVRVDRAP